MLHARHVGAVDEAFLFELYVSVRRNEFSMLAIDEQQLHALLAMQYKAQQSFYQQKFPQATDKIIYLEELPIGRMMTEIQRESIHLIDLSFLPDFRGKGHGTKLLEQLQNQAANQQLPVTLHVLMGNPAKRLYERCGFYITKEVAPYLAMRLETASNNKGFLDKKEVKTNE